MRPPRFLPLLSCQTLILCVLLTACGSGDSPKVANFDGLRDHLLSLSGSDYKIVQILDEGGLLRVNLVLVPVPDTESEVKRRAMDTLQRFQSEVGKNLRLAVWVYAEDEETCQGMAFYSPVTESYQFKSAEELP